MSEHPLDPIFHPRAVAVVGVPSNSGSQRWRGFYHSMLDAGFPERGGLYPVNPKVDDIDGLPCYPSLLDTPDPVDHVVSQVPAAIVPELVDQCVRKKVRSIHFFTAGFSETGDEEMAAMELAMVEKLRNAGIRAIGPNCMGLYVPASRVTFSNDFPMESGNVFLLSQSGANAGEIIHALTNRGVRISKAVSYGNGADLRAHDFLDYAASDPETEVVAAYIEGVRDGRPFFEALMRCARTKPVIILKGGLTQSGSNAAASHTGSLAGSTQVFDAVCLQAGALRARSMDELLDMVVAASSNTRRINGRGVALIGAGGGGGFAVLAADTIDQAGLTVPRMPRKAIERMREYIPVAGSSVNNPIDAFPPEGHLDDMLRVVATAEGIDMVFMSPMSEQWAQRRSVSQDPESEEDAESRADPESKTMAMREEATRIAQRMRHLQEDTGTLVVGILLGGRIGRMIGIKPNVFMQAAYREGIGVYPNVERAARTVARVLEWRQFREGLPDIL